MPGLKNPGQVTLALAPLGGVDHRGLNLDHERRERPRQVVAPVDTRRLVGLVLDGEVGADLEAAVLHRWRRLCQLGIGHVDVEGPGLRGVLGREPLTGPSLDAAEDAHHATPWSRMAAWNDCKSSPRNVWDIGLMLPPWWPPDPSGRDRAVIGDRIRMTSWATVKLAVRANW